MATRGTTGSNRTPSGNTKNRKNASGKTRGNQARSKASPAAQISLFSVIQSTAIGRFFLGLFAVCIIVLLDFLLSWNQFNRFFILIGIEILIAIILGWIIFLVRGRDNDET